jgi:hypothetical protein
MTGGSGVRGKVGPIWVKKIQLFSLLIEIDCRFGLSRYIHTTMYLDVSTYI